MGEGPGRESETDCTANAEYTTEGLATDPGSRIPLTILVVETNRVVSTEDLIVGEGRLGG